MTRLPARAVPAVLAVLLAASAPAQTIRLLKDIVPGSQGSRPTGFTDLFGATIFAANPGTGWEIWRTDGTTAGTTLVAPLPATAIWVQHMTRLGDRVMFLREGRPPSGSAEVWTTDGTSGGTNLVTSVPGMRYVHDAVAAGDRLLVYGQDYASVNSLWASDGSAAGTTVLQRFTPTTSGELVQVGDRVVLRAGDAATGFELWMSDGTPAGTRLVRDVQPGAGSGLPEPPIRFRDAVWFIGDDGTNGMDLWKSDGTAAGTVAWADLAIPGVARAWLVGAAGEHVFATVQHASGGNDVWSVHRTTGQKTLLPVNGSAAYGAAIGDRLLFEEGLPVDLWISDGTAAGTQRIPVGQSGVFPREIAVTGSRRAFVALQPGLWVTDGTAGGTRQLTNISGLFLPQSLAQSDARLYFAARTSNSLFEPYVIDLGATSAPVGTGLGVGTRVPDIRTTDPVLGAQTTVTLDNVVAGAVVVLLISPGLPRAARFAPGAFAYVNPATSASISASTTADRWSTTMAVPNDNGLRGLPVVFQAVLVGTGAARGFELSNASYAHLDS